jgi:hypothetical protein
MDLERYLRVLWRFRWLVASGLVIASVLALLSFVRVDLRGSPHFTYRAGEEWASSGSLLITQARFPEGRSVFEQAVPPLSKDEIQTFAPQFADPNRFAALATLYAELATSDAVRRTVLRDGPLNGVVEATPVTLANGTPLPLLTVGSISSTPTGALVLARRAIRAFREHVESQQRNSGIPVDQRVVIEVINQPGNAALLRGRPTTLPILVFLTVFLAFVGVAFILENLRPRIAPVSSVAARSSEPPSARLSA